MKVNSEAYLRLLIIVFEHDRWISLFQTGRDKSVTFKRTHFAFVNKGQIQIQMQNVSF
jgi:hypothetical protein